MTDFRQQIEEKSRPVAFKRNMGLFGATTLGIGSLMGAGLYVLVGIAAAEAGPGLWLAYTACGLLTFLSVGMYAELSKHLPISGGGYLYAYNRLGSFFGFLVGWHLAVGSIFACALYAYGFASYLTPFLPFATIGRWLIRAIAIALVAVLCLLALRGGKSGNRLQSAFTWGNLVVVVILCVVGLFSFDAARFSPMLPKGIGGIGDAISLIYISFFGYQLIANSSEEIREPERTVPRAMFLSLGVAFFFYLAVAVIAVAAVPWTELAASNAPLVLVAARGIGPAGAILIGLGALLASVAALNGTLGSQARQIFAMGRDRIVPEVLGHVSKRTGVPAMALLAGGSVTIVVLLFADLTFVAKAANFSLLFSMLPLSLALAGINRERVANGTAISLLKQSLPFAALVANAALLLTLDHQSLMFGGTIVGVGCLIFFGYSYSSEKRGQAGFSVHLSNDRSPGFMFRGDKILVPMANPHTQAPLLKLAEALSIAEGGEILVLTVVLAREGQHPREALSRKSMIGNAIHVLDGAARVAKQENVAFTPVVRAAWSLAEGIAHAAREERAKLVIMGWSAKDDTTPSELVTAVTENCRSHLAFLDLKTAPGETPSKYRRVGVAISGGRNNPLMVHLASALADQRDGRITYFSVLLQNYEKAELNRARRTHIDAIGRHASLVPCGTEILRSENPLQTIIDKTRDLDLLIIGAGDARSTGGDRIGSFTSMITNRAHCSVIVVLKDTLHLSI